MSIAEVRAALDRIKTVAIDPWDHPSCADVASMREALDDAEAQTKRHQNRAERPWCPVCGFAAVWPCPDRERADRTTARVLAWALRHGGAQ